MISPPLKSISQAERDKYEAEGYCIIRQLISPEEVAVIRDTFQELGDRGPIEGLQHIPQGADTQDPLARYPRMMHPHRHDELAVGPLALRYLLDQRIGDMVHDLFGEEPVAAQSMYYFKPPGSRGQDLHQDNFYLRVAPGTCMAAWMAIDDADQENGGMVVVPGSHRLDIACPEEADRTKFFSFHHVPVPEGMQEVAADLKAGDVLFFNGSVIHGSYPNTSPDRFRRSLIFHYVPYASRETSRGYRPLLRMNGAEADHIEDAGGGGPCGGEVEAMSPH